MSAKALKALMGTVAGLVILWLAVSYFPRGDRGPGGPSETLATFFDGVTPEVVSPVECDGPRPREEQLGRGADPAAEQAAQPLPVDRGLQQVAQHV